MYKRVVVKIGSGVITKDGTLDEAVVAQIAAQISDLRAQGTEVVLVTSGAVATGKGQLTLPQGADDVVRKQTYAAVGQIALMALYAKLFGERGQVCAQILVTKEDFRDRQHYLNMKNCLENLLKSGVIPVVNENDVIAVTELIFTDNDELAGLLASSLDADAVIILSSIDGVLDKSPSDPDAKVISEIDFSKGSFEEFISSDRSSSGRGGMHTKFGIAKKLAAEGIPTHIANGRAKNIIIDLVDGKPLGTRFVPTRKLSSVKRRIAHSDGLAKGAIRVNDCTEEMLRAGKVMSLLPVGVTAVEGSFEKGDVIEIRDTKDTRMGFGVAASGSEAVDAAKGEKGGRAVVHYDYLFIG